MKKTRSRKSRDTVPLSITEPAGGKGGGVVGEVREKVEGQQEGSKIPTRLTVSPVNKLYKTPVKTTFRNWCLFRYLVHGRHLGGGLGAKISVRSRRLTVERS